ncbi:hypothetical protein [Haloarchaeobius sp. DFWS5]|uniref:hypothetical protein n=1 Tax=Haloarchaeobius sp. DFWS5 TaxID=3446114 RepID=UPI003EB9A005
MTRQDYDAHEDADEQDDKKTDADRDSRRKKRHDEHLQDVDVGAGCTEIWEHLSDQRDEE